MIKNVILIISIAALCMGGQPDTASHYSQIRNGELKCHVIKYDSILSRFPMYQTTYAKIQKVKDSLAAGDTSKIDAKSKECISRATYDLAMKFIFPLNESVERFAKENNIAYIVNLTDSSLFFARNEDRQYTMPQEYLDSAVPLGETIKHNPNVISLVVQHNNGDVTDSMQYFINNDEKLKSLESDASIIYRHFCNCVNSK